MAHFAEVDENNIVTRVLVVPDNQEHRGQDFLANDLALGGTWIQASYTERIRCCFPGEGYIYDADLDIFMPPKPKDNMVFDEATKMWWDTERYNQELDCYVPPSPFPSWTIFDKNTMSWLPPMPYPGNENEIYNWNEKTQSWDAVSE